MKTYVFRFYFSFSSPYYSFLYRIIITTEPSSSLCVINWLKDVELCLVTQWQIKRFLNTSDTSICYSCCCFIFSTKHWVKVGTVKNLWIRKFSLWRAFMKHQSSYSKFMLFSLFFRYIKVHQKTISCFISLAWRVTPCEFGRQSIRWLRRDELETFLSCQHIMRYIKSQD